MFAESSYYFDDDISGSSDGDNESACVLSVCESLCGDGIVGIMEACDDGNTNNGDGCSANCSVECGWRCFGGSPTAKDTCTTRCGDGKLAGMEACDDGNSLSGDGCSAHCSVESGWMCQPSTSFDSNFFNGNPVIVCMRAHACTGVDMGLVTAKILCE